MNNEVKSLSLTKSKVAEIDGEHRVTFVASSNKEDRDYETVEIGTFRLPLKGGGEIRVDAIPAEGVSNVDIPLLTNHNLYSVEGVIGSVRKAFFKNNELVFECGISSREKAQDLFKLISEGHLDNAFSIQFRDFEYNFDAKTISNGEVIEVSLVTRGANKEARVLEAKSTKGETKVDDNAQKTTPDEKVEEKPTETPETKKEETEAKEKPAEETSEEETKSEEKEEKMVKSTNKDVAKAVITDPASQAATTEATGAKGYLGSKAAVADFANVLVKNAGKSATEVREAWKAHLAGKGITDNDNVLLPVALVNKINDTVEKNGTILKLIDQTGLTVYRTALNTVGIDDARGRARGHKGKGATKNEQTIVLKDRTLRAQYIYKFLKVPKEMIRENQDTGALVEYIMGELPKRLVAEIERAIVIGDGRDEDDDDKITEVISIREDAEDPDSVFATEYTPEEGDNFYDTITKAATEIEADGKLYLVMSRKEKANLKLTKIGDHYVFGVGGNVAEAVEVEAIITPSWMKFDSAHVAYLVAFDEYKGVGDKTSEAYTAFALETNEQKYLEEQYFGGGLAGYKSAVAIKRTGSES